jgi:hypothetical protein
MGRRRSTGRDLLGGGRVGGCLDQLPQTVPTALAGSGVRFHHDAPAFEVLELLAVGSTGGVFFTMLMWMSFSSRSGSSQLTVSPFPDVRELGLDQEPNQLNDGALSDGVALAGLVEEQGGHRLSRARVAMILVAARGASVGRNRWSCSESAFFAEHTVPAATPTPRY